MMKKTKKRNFTPLFFKILRDAYLPLLILLASLLFVGMRHEYKMKHHIYVLEGKLAVEAFLRELDTLLNETPEIFDSKAKLKNKSKKIEKKLGFLMVDFINPAVNASIAEENPLSPNHNAQSVYYAVPLQKQLEYIQTSLNQKRRKIPYHTVIDEKALRVYGFVPFTHKSTKQILIAVMEFELPSFQATLIKSLNVLGFMMAIAIVAILFFCLKLTFRIVYPIQILNQACREILNGNLDKRVKVKTGDEIELLARNFNQMCRSLLTLTLQARTSNPLTHLPGNPGIVKELQDRIDRRSKFVFFHVDIDHFKAYNDQYGLARGDEVIQKVSLILLESIKETGQEDDFVGHQGGDDFILILQLSHAEVTAKRVCDQFDIAIRNFYTQEDLQRGYFMGVDSRNHNFSVDPEIKQHPLMSISLAGVSNFHHNYKNPEEVFELASHVKKKVKRIPYSTFIIEEHEADRIHEEDSAPPIAS